MLWPTLSSYFDTVSRAHSRIQAVSLAWTWDYPAASNFIPALLSCKALNFASFCDPRIDAQMKRATALQLSDPAKASALWARIDRELTDRALSVPVDNQQFLDVVSKRVGNYQLNPGFGALRDQLWVR